MRFVSLRQLLSAPPACVDLGLKDLWVIISMMVLCNANAIIEYDRRRSGLSSAPLDMEYDNSSIER